MTYILSLPGKDNNICGQFSPWRHKKAQNLRARLYQENLKLSRGWASQLSFFFLAVLKYPIQLNFGDTGLS